jgi:methionyl-tRNA formyltransferase
LDDGTVACGADSLEIVELQPDGKKPMTLAAYRNGKKWDEGMRLESIR